MTDAPSNPPAPSPDLSKPSAIKAWIAAQGFLPSKVLGQNFLVDGNILQIMADTAAIGPADRVLEVGPGLGALTDRLLASADFVVAIEKDRRLAAHLRETHVDHPRLALLEADALEVDLGQLKQEHRLNKLASNLPYSVGSRVLVEAFMLADGFDRIAVTVQLEVGERLAAACDTSDYGLLSIWAQLDYRARVVKRISPACFYPRPTVTSAIVLLERCAERRRNLRNAVLFDALLKHAFSMRRKQIGTALASFHFTGATDRAEALTRAGITTTRRPETLSVEDWIHLADALSGG